MSRAFKANCPGLECLISHSLSFPELLSFHPHTRATGATPHPPGCYRGGACSSPTASLPGMLTAGEQPGKGGSCEFLLGNPAAWLALHTRTTQCKNLFFLSSGTDVRKGQVELKKETQKQG